MQNNDTIKSFASSAIRFTKRNPEAVVIAAAIAASPFAPFVALPVAAATTTFWPLRKTGIEHPEPYDDKEERRDIRDTNIVVVVASAVVAAWMAAGAWVWTQNAELIYKLHHHASAETTDVVNSQPKQAKLEARARGAIFKL